MATIVDKINDGSYDKHLDRIGTAVSHRQALLRERARAIAVVELVPGTKVRIKVGLRPKYLTGVTGVIVDHPRMARHGSLWMKLDYRVGRYSAMVPVGIPAHCLEKIEDE